MKLSLTKDTNYKKVLPLFVALILLVAMSFKVSAHSDNSDFWRVEWFKAFAFTDSSGEVMTVRYRDHGQADYHCPYVQSRRGKNGRISESRQNCSTRDWMSHRQGLLALEGGGLVWQPGWWRVCRSGHWKCRGWNIEV